MTPETPDGARTPYDHVLQEILAEPATSFSLRKRLEADALRDPLDALADAESLLALANLRWRAIEQRTGLEPQERARGMVVLGFGPQPVDLVVRMGRICARDDVVDPRVAHMAGATYAMGSPAALSALAARLCAGSLGAITDQLQAHPGISLAAARWLATGERGLSSEAIFQHLVGVRLPDSEGPLCPADSGDLARCRALLEEVPELAPLFEQHMASASPQWAALVPLWGRLCAMQDAGEHAAVSDTIRNALAPIPDHPYPKGT